MKGIRFLLLFTLTHTALSACLPTAAPTTEVPTEETAQEMETEPAAEQTAEAIPPTESPQEPTEGTDGTITLSINSEATGYKIRFGSLTCNLFYTTDGKLLTTDTSLCEPVARSNGYLDGSIIYTGQVLPLTPSGTPDFLTAFPNMLPTEIRANDYGFQIKPSGIGYQWGFLDALIQSAYQKIVFQFNVLEPIETAPPSGNNSGNNSGGGSNDGGSDGGSSGGGSGGGEESCPPGFTGTPPDCTLEQNN